MSGSMGDFLGLLMLLGVFPTIIIVLALDLREVRLWIRIAVIVVAAWIMLGPGLAVLSDFKVVQEQPHITGYVGGQNE